MAGSLNKVTLIGNVGKDPEIRSTNEGKEIASFSIATTESWKDRNTGERKDRTEWHRIVIFNEALVNLIKNYVKKGSKLYIEGSLQTRKWVDNTGQEKYTTEIILQNYSSNLVLLDSKGNNGFGGDAGRSPDHSADKSNNFEHAELDDDIPF